MGTELSCYCSWGTWFWVDRSVPTWRRPRSVTRSSPWHLVLQGIREDHLNLGGLGRRVCRAVLELQGILREIKHPISTALARNNSTPNRHCSYIQYLNTQSTLLLHTIPQHPINTALYNISTTNYHCSYMQDLNTQSALLLNAISQYPISTALTYNSSTPNQHWSYIK